MSALPADGLPLAELWPSLRALSREAFLAEYAAPFLVELAAAAPKDFKDFHTFHGEPREALSDVGDDPDAGVTAESRVWHVAKRSDVFPGKITIGRSTNNDLLIQNPRVSKLHAWFVGEGDRIALVDAESSNGTFHNGRRLDGLERVALKNRDQLSFGGTARFVFVDAGHFYQRAKLIMRGATR